MPQLLEVWNDTVDPRHLIGGIAIGVGIAEGTDDQGRECWYCVQLFRYTGQKITWVDEPAHP